MNNKVKVFEVTRQACYRWVNKVSRNIEVFDSLDTPKKFGKYLRKGYSLELIPVMYKVISYTQHEAARRRKKVKAAQIPCVVIVRDYDDSVWGTYSNADLAW